MSSIICYYAYNHNIIHNILATRLGPDELDHLSLSSVIINNNHNITRHSPWIR